MNIVKKIYKDEIPNNTQESIYGGLEINISDLSQDFFNMIAAIKKSASAHHQIMKEYQKQCGREDIQGARFFAAESKDAFKAYKACCYILARLSPDCFGDCKKLQRFEIPLNYEESINLVLSYAETRKNPFTGEVLKDE